MRRLKVISVTEGMAAHTAGIKKGDILDKYNDIDLVSDEALSHAARSASGNTIRLTIATQDGNIEKSLPAGRLGIEVFAIDFEKETYFAEAEIDKKISQVIATTTQSIDGHKATKYLDIISAETVCGIGLISEMFASFTDTFGGRNKTLQRTLMTAKNDCLNELKKEAVRIGANGIIGVDLDYSEFSGQGKSMLFVVATGTAVFLEPA